MRDDEPRAGRPRDPGRDEAILAAALDLLGEVGYERVTVRAIAQRAGAGLATLYRRWPTKEELVVDAVASFPVIPHEPHPGDDPIDALVRLLTGLLDLLQGTRSGLLPNLIGQLQANPTLAEALRNRVVLPRLALVAEQLLSVPGVDPARVAEAAELVPASLFFQSLVLGRRLGEPDLRRLVHTAIHQATPPG